MTGQLQGRVAIVTGAARGIGAAIARLFAAEGAHLVIADIDGEAARAIADTLSNAHGVRADVSSPADAESLAAAAETRFGRLDILINNAGIGLNKPFMDTTPEDIDRIMRVNLTGMMLCSQAALRRMLPAGYGRIVSISSISGQRGNVGRTAYGASKAAIELVTRVMTAELAAPGVTFNAIAPGAIETEMAAALHDPATRRAFQDRTPQGRYGTVDEVAAAALFLASEAAGYVCGQVLNADGGFVSAGFTARTLQ
jgi:NAD(P)-dependent dehydrogenase (short-subunit alcohol dehydrogenase family)